MKCRSKLIIMKHSKMTGTWTFTQKSIYNNRCSLHATVAMFQFVYTSQILERKKNDWTVQQTDLETMTELHNKRQYFKRVSSSADGVEGHDTANYQFKITLDLKSDTPNDNKHMMLSIKFSRIQFKIFIFPAHTITSLNNVYGSNAHALHITQPMKSIPKLLYIIIKAKSYNCNYHKSQGTIWLLCLINKITSNLITIKLLNKHNYIKSYQKQQKSI